MPKQVETTDSQSGKGNKIAIEPSIEMALASHWKLMWWKFRNHRLALLALIVLGMLYLVVGFSQFLMPYDPQKRNSDLLNAPPQPLRFWGDGHLQIRPFVYGYDQTMDLDTLMWRYKENPDKKYPLYLFVEGHAYKFWGLFRTSVHLFGTKEEGYAHLLGTDLFGRDYLGRLIYGGQISLSIGLVGIGMSFLIGMITGGVSGYYGGFVDTVIQRIIELLRSLPTLPLWMGLSAAVPVSWPVPRVYFMITIILSLVGWTDLARVVRGKVLSTREEDFVMAAHLGGAGERWIIIRHLLPSVFSYVVVSLTLSIPSMILGETSLSFLGLGLQPPALSWGVLLQEAQNVRTIALYPWLLSPAVLIIFTVLCFNFVGDGLRDAADPYSR